jgi:predicted metal-binding membrane protein
MGPPPRPLRRLSVAIAFVACAATTAWACAAMRGGMAMPGGWTMSMAWMRMAGQGWAAAAATFVAMWAVMMAAMMTPSLSPVLLHHRRPVRVAAGYLAVWTAIGAAIYPVGVALAIAEMRAPALARAVPLATGVALIAAGVVQLGPGTLTALARCRDRSCCLPGRRPGPRAALRDGVRLGRRCARCCAAPMAVLVLWGVMDVVAMIVVGAAITVERLAPRPRPIVRALGAAAIAAGGIAIARAALA